MTGTDVPPDDARRGTTRVLFVEDDQSVRSTAADTLEADDLVVVTAPSAEAGLEELADGWFDCIVSDYEMPGMDGLEFLSAVRDDDPDVPFVLFTGKGTETVAADAIAAGATDYLRKGGGPGQFELLANRVSNAVDQYRATRRAAELDRIRTLASDVTQALVRSSDRREAERAVCDIFSGSEPYPFAWIGSHDPEAGRVAPRAAAGDRADALEAIALEDGGDVPTGPVGVALREGPVAVSREPENVPEFAAARAAGVADGVQAVAAVLLGDDADAGVLVVYADRADAFGQDELELLEDVGTDVAHALRSFGMRDQLRTERDRREALFANAPSPVIAGEVTAGGERHVITDANEAFLEVFGHDRDAVVGRDVGEVVVPDDGHDRHESFRDRVASGEPVVAPVERVTTDGPREFILHLTPFTGDDGLADGWYAWYTDVSDRIARQQALEELHSTARAFMSSETREEVASVAVDAARDVLDLPWTGVHLHDADADRLRPVAWTDASEELVDGIPTFEPGDGLAWEVFESGEPQIQDDLSTVPGRLNEDTPLGSEIVLPLGDQGVLLAGSPDVNAFEEADVSLARTLAANATTALSRLEREAALRAERTFTDQALDALGDLFYVVGPDGALRRWNDHVVEVTGFDDETIATMDAVEFFRESDREAIREALASPLAEGRTTVEAHVLTADGERIPHEFTGTRLTGPDGEVTGIVGIGRDVSERKERERALRRERERFSGLFESVPEPVAHVQFHDGDAVVRNVNAAFEAVFGYEADTVVGESLDDYVVPPDREPDGEDINRRAAAGKELTREVVRQTADGERTFLFRVVQTDTGPGHNEAVGMYVDITEQKRRERQLQRYEALLEVVNDGVYALDSGGRYTYVNRYAAEKTGYDREELLGATPAKILPDDDVDRFDAAIRDLVAGDRDTYAEEVEVQPKAGEPYLAEVKVTALTDDGEHERTVGVVRDVTDRKERERRLERQNERLDRFASVVSHDLQNPLNVAMGYLEEVRGDVDRDELDAVAHALDRMEALVEDVLTMARFGQEPTEVEPVAVESALEGCWENVETADATLVIAENTTIGADQNRLAQLLENLIRNAVEHAGEDVTITVGPLPDAEGFYVADDGPGIPQEDRDAVFEGGYSGGEGGTGLGLSIVAEIARAHDWEVAVTESDEGGARFEFRGGD